MKGRKLIAAAAVAALLLAALIPACLRIHSDLEERRRESIRDSVLTAARQCYAVEGVYPENFEYLERYYGIAVDRSRYIVSYECIASNQPPEVMVLKR